MTAELEARDRTELLRIAHATLREYLSSGFYPPGAPHRKPLLAHRAAALRLTLGGQQRGFASWPVVDTPLYLVIERLAVAAATRDAKGEPLRAEELGEVRVELAIFSHPAPASTSDLDPGRHGLILTRGARRALVMPEEAAPDLTPDGLVAEACRRAGLPADAGQASDAALLRFTVERFGDPRPT